MDNQQERLLWWLGGIIDGEGCITINHHRLHQGTIRETLLFSPVIIIVNTNKLLVETCQSVLRKATIPFYIAYGNATNVRKEKWSIHIVGLKRVSKTLSILSPYIIAKSKEASLVKQFCDLRLTRPREKTSYGGMATPLYSDKEFDIIMEIAKIHNRNPQRLYAEISRYKEKERPKIIRKRNGQFANQDIVQLSGKP